MLPGQLNAMMSCRGERGFGRLPDIGQQVANSISPLHEKRQHRTDLLLRRTRQKW
jgi:hypothetical protein